MKILIAADMEGVTGVVCWDHVTSTHAEYGRFRRLMTGDVNAAIRAAYDAGADEVVVADGHGSGRNLLIEELDPRVRLNCGSPSPFSMVEGIGPEMAGVVYIGYHARSGTPDAILDHTWISAVTSVQLNGLEVGEIGLNAAVCGHFNVPVIALSGCRAACAEIEALLGSMVETAPVKTAQGRMAAECLTPEASVALIGQAVGRAVSRLRRGEAPRPWTVSPPVEVTVEFHTSDLTDRAAILPGVQRQGRSLRYTASDLPAAYQAFRALVRLT
jgi:D-amino peptidase